MPYSQLLTTRKRKNRMRSLRVIWRDSMALWNEFKLPIILTLLVTLGGGYIYGELNLFAGKENIPLIDRPYIMMELMILETPGDAPSEWYLVIFWYLLPPTFIFIVGLGAADFVHLFFNRNDRQDAWREAVASTFRNHIIVFGAGHVGIQVIRELASMGVDIVVIDNSPDPGVDYILNELDIPLIVGDGREGSVLEKAKIRDASSLVICTGDDHTNLEAIMRIREINSDIRIVARVWDTKFGQRLERFMNVQNVLSSSDLSAPAFAGAALGIEITQTLTINDVPYSMTRFNVVEDSFLDGETVGHLQSEYDMDIVLYGREETTEVQPAHDFVVRYDDTLVIFARHKTILEIVSRNMLGKKGRKRKLKIGR